MGWLYRPQVVDPERWSARIPDQPRIRGRIATMPQPVEDAAQWMPSFIGADDAM
jgi:hypothetical protein